MTNLNETQIVVLFRAINKRDGVIGSFETATTSCTERAYNAAINGLLKRGLIEQSGRSGSDDWSKDGWRFRVSDAGAFALESLEDDETIAELEAEEAEEQEEVEQAGSRIKEPYKQSYKARKAEGGSGQGCNDDLDRWTVETFMKPMNDGKSKRLVLDLDKFVDFASQNEIDTDRYTGLNVGMIKMNVVNRLRGRIRKGKSVVYNGQTIIQGEASEEKLAA